jgi:hypothetical protein
VGKLVDTVEHKKLPQVIQKYHLRNDKRNWKVADVKFWIEFIQNAFTQKCRGVAIRAINCNKNRPLPHGITKHQYVKFVSNELLSDPRFELVGGKIRPLQQKRMHLQHDKNDATGSPHLQDRSSANFKVRLRTGLACTSRLEIPCLCLTTLSEVIA